jgi:hypothetical protein
MTNQPLEEASGAASSENRPFIAKMEFLARSGDKYQKY